MHRAHSGIGMLNSDNNVIYEMEYNVSYAINARK